jgi:hypothetical protein
MSINGFILVESIILIASILGRSTLRPYNGLTFIDGKIPSLLAITSPPIDRTLVIVVDNVTCLE